MYIDECKQDPYLLVGVLVAEYDKVSLRKILSSLLLYRQRSIHFKNENSRHKKRVLASLQKHEFQVVVFRHVLTTKLGGRNQTLKRLVSYSLGARVSQLVFELDETSRISDDQMLANCIPLVSGRRLINWEHRLRHQEPLLWVADAVAWCVNRGGEWERLVRPMILATLDC
jgi:hypothetical protein